MAVSKSALLLFLGILSFGTIPFTKADVEVLIDAYPNITLVSQGTTVVMVCHVSGVPSVTMVTYQWSCPNYGCGARGLQSDGNIVSRREEGSMIAIDVVNDTDSGDYTCNVSSSGIVFGTATYRINNVEAGLVLTGKNGMIPLNSLFINNSRTSVLSPFEGAAGEYIRCGSTGGRPGWYNEADKLVPMSTTLNIHFHSAPNIGELWFDTMTRSTVNREFRCTPQSGSLNRLSSFIGLFFLHQKKLGGSPRTISSITAKSITLSWSPVDMANGYHVRYRREDLSISLPPTYIRSSLRLRESQNRSVTLQNLEPGVSYQINVWDFQYINGPTDHKVSSPFEMTVKTRESVPTAPRLLTVVRNTSTSVDLNWIPPRHPNGVIHYEIEHSTNESFAESTTISTKRNSTYHTVPVVPEFPRHYFRVVAVNSAGVGRSSSSNIVTVDICFGIKMCPSSGGPGTVPLNSGPIAAAIAVVIVLLIVLLVIVISVICVIVIRKRKESREHAYAEACKPTNPNKGYTSREEPVVSTGPPTDHGKEDNEDVDSLDVVINTKEDMLIYQNTASSIPKHKPIPVGKFPQHVEAMFNKGKKVITNEFKSMGPMTEDSISTGEANKTKNRYKNIFPYDHSRVVLSVTSSDSGDYINASYIDGYKKTNAFIAAQGPTVATLRDFCQMIWDVKTTMVVMVTKVVEGTKKKCEQYHPEIVGGTLTFGPYTLKTRTITHYVDFEVRTIELSLEETDDRHAFDHYLFTGWPDYGVPQYPTSLIRMLYHVREHKISDIPIIVHCSAGVGRTGTFVGLDYILDQINTEKTVDIKGVVMKMRGKRMFMVQTVDQYTFLYTAVRELLLCGDTSVRATDLRRFIAESRKDGFKTQFKILGKLTQPSDNAEKVVDNMDKVRYRDRLPAKGKHLYVPLNGKGSVFINASFVNGYHAPKAFIAAQSPMSNTVGEFWSMIVDKKVATVVLLCPLWENRKETCHMFWPQTEQEQVDYGDEYFVTLMKSQSDSIYDVHRLTVVTNEHSKRCSVTLFHYKQWEEGSNPNNVSLIKCLMAVQQEQLKQSSATHQPTVVACNDGLGRSCTFIAIWSLLEQMKTEGQIDVLSTVKSIRTQRPGAVNHLEYYTCCYDALVDYVDTFEGYSNFRT